MPPPTSYLLPYATLQPTYSEVYSDVLSNRVAAENVWLSVYSDNAPQKSIHASLLLQQKEKDRVEEEDQVVMELTKGGTNLDLQEIHTGLDKGKAKEGDGVAPSLLIQTKTQPSASSTSPTTLANKPALPPTTLRVPLFTIPAILKGRRSQGAIDRGGGGQISAFDVGYNDAESLSHFVAGGEDGQVVLGGLPRPSSSSSSNTSTDESQMTIEEKAQHRIKLKAQQQRIPLKGHLGDVRSARFFPSGQVLLTTSSDLTIRLYSLEGVNPRTFEGHKRAVTATQILSRGKRFLSASLDGTVRLWDVAAEKCLKTIAVKRMSGVESLSVMRINGHETDTVEDGMGKYIIFAGLSSGWIDVISLRLDLVKAQQPPEEEGDGPIPAEVSITEESLVSIPPIQYPSDTEGKEPGATDFWSLDATGSVWSLDAVRSTKDEDAILVAAGTKSGVVRLFSVGISALSAIEQAKQAERDNPDAMDTSTSGAEGFQEHFNFRRNTSGITNLRFVPSSASTSTSVPDLVIATQDGTPARITFDEQGQQGQGGGGDGTTSSLDNVVPRVKEEYVGWEAGDPVEGIAIEQQRQEEVGRVFLAGAEGCVRAYAL